MCSQDMAQYYVNQQNQQRANQQYMDQQCKTRQNKKLMAGAVVLGAIAVAGVWWFSGSPAKAYGVWRVVGSADMNAAQARMAEAVMDKMGVEMYFEFEEHVCTVHIFAGDQAVSRTSKCEWQPRRGKLYCKEPDGKSGIVFTVVDDNTLIVETLAVEDRSSRSKTAGMKLTRSSRAEVEAAKEAAGE